MSKFRFIPNEEVKKEEVVIEDSILEAEEPVEEEVVKTEPTEEKDIPRSGYVRIEEEPKPEPKMYGIKIGKQYFVKGDLGKYTTTDNKKEAFATINREIAYNRALIVHGEVIEL